MNRGSFAPGAPSDPSSALTPAVVITPDDVLVGACAGLHLPLVFFRTNKENDASGASVNPTPASTPAPGSALVNEGNDHVQNNVGQALLSASPNTEAAAGLPLPSDHNHRKRPVAVLNKGLSTTEGLMTAMLLSNPSYRAKFGSSGGSSGGEPSDQRDLDQDQQSTAGALVVSSSKGSINEQRKDGGSIREGANGLPLSLPGTAPDTAKGPGLGPGLGLGAGAFAGEYLEQVLEDFNGLSGSRRERLLSIDARLWLQHLSQSNPLNFDVLLSVRDMFSDARASYIELFGSLLMAFGVQVAEALDKMRLLEAEMISSVKALDARWQFVCQMTQEKLSSLSSFSGHTRDQVNPLSLAYILPQPCRGFIIPPPSPFYTPINNHLTYLNALSQNQVNEISSDCICSLFRTPLNALSHLHQHTL